MRITFSQVEIVEGIRLYMQTLIPGLDNVPTDIELVTAKGVVSAEINLTPDLLVKFGTGALTILGGKQETRDTMDTFDAPPKQKMAAQSGNGQPPATLKEMADAANPFDKPPLAPES